MQKQRVKNDTPSSNNWVIAVEEFWSNSSCFSSLRFAAITHAQLCECPTHSISVRLRSGPLQHWDHFLFQPLLEICFCALDHHPAGQLNISWALAVGQVVSRLTQEYFSREKSSLFTQGLQGTQNMNLPPPCWQLVWGDCALQTYVVLPCSSQREEAFSWKTFQTSHTCYSNCAVMNFNMLTEACSLTRSSWVFL